MPCLGVYLPRVWLSDLIAACAVSSLRRHWDSDSASTSRSWQCDHCERVGLGLELGSLEREEAQQLQLGRRRAVWRRRRRASVRGVGFYFRGGCGGRRVGMVKARGSAKINRALVLATQGNGVCRVASDLTSVYSATTSGPARRTFSQGGGPSK